ncbi:hypothetical protein [Tomitella fengzijianii]|uniref:DUF2207 domain-containing protein n=1 Tax=Tomitella fengzijianii TaxID=2597660 RepID=A0A516X453_9ACTN|nr:hypothetical protein [Tomitella fengzijianii]QDQ97859.1 hypothetical protein FO059_11730 [Tomitella fengzijianii]
MLIAALVVTLVGFVLLVVALVISSVAFAWACIGVCIVGFVLLVVDIVRGRRATNADSADDGAGRDAREDADDDGDEVPAGHGAQDETD